MCIVKSKGRTKTKTFWKRNQSRGDIHMYACLGSARGHALKLVLNGYNNNNETWESSKKPMKTGTTATSQKLLLLKIADAGRRKEEGGRNKRSELKGVKHMYGMHMCVCMYFGATDRINKDSFILFEQLSAVCNSLHRSSRGLNNLAFVF